ncbi:MAG: type II secretion system GspH family protein [Natronospirillum sp.]|uniref:type II secretion system protein n=1 Tax=Natronospirillum sp. TaxID=2812955 RepID=UPI0025F5E9AA|nr:type II secretion system protein [Natronospirillum sp.]MCH8550808.1 type II secretion system GspH family protein [Natronospirillum sp.]
MSCIDAVPARNRAGGFTLIEVVLVIVILGILSGFALPRLLDLQGNAQYSNVQAQATALRSRNTTNELTCRLGQDDCVDITSTGDQACVDGMNAFLPELDQSLYSLRNINSSTPRDQWADDLEPGEALFWITRFLGDDTSNHPNEAWFNTWNATQPCVLSLAD